MYLLYFSFIITPLSFRPLTILILLPLNYKRVSFIDIESSLFNYPPTSLVYKLIDALPIIEKVMAFILYIRASLHDAIYLVSFNDGL